MMYVSSFAFFSGSENTHPCTLQSDTTYEAVSGCVHKVYHTFKFITCDLSGRGHFTCANGLFALRSYYQGSAWR
jgi:hypothetical protein